MASVDKNIVALLRPDAFTVRVILDINEDVEGGPKLVDYMPGQRWAKGETSKVYTYISVIKVAAGDIVVIPANGALKLGRVVQVDADVQIEADDSRRYSWVVDVVDMLRFQKQQEENRVIEEAVRSAYQRTIKTGLRDRLLAELAPEDRGLLSSLLRVAAPAAATDAGSDDSEGGVG